ncbi:MFS transporter [Lichenicoccus roseus]|uniref:MFS transporter n=2 Tax=Lichenicoccus roseus TaxID=2683649 RepID=A0A5R9J4Y0_9PROT|nr:MFS transporter [Lichenicoccus roseus]
MYTLAFLDRVNLGVAKQALQSQVGISGAAFALGAGLFFVTYAVFELPSNLILHRVGPRVWMARIMITWGLVSAATIFVTGDTSFYGLRLLLGAAEAGFFPGAILFMTYWFPSAERGRVIGLFYLGYPLALLFGNPASGALLDLDGWLGLAGWQWMFLIDGLLASVVGIGVLFWMPDSPDSVHWLEPDEKRALNAAIAAEGEEKRAVGRHSLLDAFRDVRLLHFIAIYFALQIGSYGVTFYLPTQVSELVGRKIGFIVGLVSALPWACGIAVTLFWPAMAVRLGRRRLFGVISLLGISIGIAVSAQAPPVIAIIALCVAASGIISAQPVFWTFPADHFGGVAAAAAFAIINSLGNLGGFVAPNLREWADHHFAVHGAGLYALCASGLIAAVLLLLLPEPRAATLQGN